jgi:hypothetical protein
VLFSLKLHFKQYCILKTKRASGRLNVIVVRHQPNCLWTMMILPTEHEAQLCVACKTAPPDRPGMADLR